MDDDITKEIVFRRRGTRGNIRIDQTKCKLNFDQTIFLIREYRTRMWQFRNCGGMYVHLTEAIKCYQQLAINGIKFKPIHRRKVRR